MNLKTSKEIARLFDTNGRVGLWKSNSKGSIVLHVEITGITKEQAEFIKNENVYGYVVAQKSHRVFKFSIAADFASSFLRKMWLYSKWQKN